MRIIANQRRQAALIALAAAATAAAATPLNCPARASWSGPATSAPSDGWSAEIATSAHPLSGVSLYDGPPAEGAALQPQRVSADGRRLTWSLEALAAPPAWLSCDYGGGAVRLVRRLPDAVRRCTAHVDQFKAPRRVAISVDCQ